MRNKLALISIVIVTVALYALTIRGATGIPTAADFKNNLDQATMPFELSPERGRFTHVLALANNRTYALSQELADVAYPDVGYYGDNFYSFFAPGLAYMTVPFYLFGLQFDIPQVTTFAFISLMSVLAMLFLFKIAREILKQPLWTSLLTVLAFAFASTAWSYAVTLYQHHVTTFFILASFYAVWKYRQHGRFSWLWAAFVWLNFGLAIFIDYPNGVLMLPMIAYLVISSLKISLSDMRLKVGMRVGLVVSALVFIVVIGLHGLHNQKYYGSWTQLSGTLPSYERVQELSDPESTDIVLVQDENEKKKVTRFFSEENLPKGFAILLWSQERGLFFFAPIFLLALIGIAFSIRKGLTLEIGILLSSVIVNILLYSSWGDPWGGWAYGPRYLIPSMAILSLFIGTVLTNVRHTFVFKLSAFILFMYSSAIALLGVLTTNAVPPRHEAVDLENKFNYFLNLDFFNRGESGSFFFNTYLADSLTLSQYFFILYGLLLAIAFFIIFIMSRQSHVS